MFTMLTKSADAR